MKRLSSLTTAVVFASLSGLALAQAPAPAAAPAADVPKHTCGDLPEMPRKSAPDSQKRHFERSMRDYGTCLQNYVKERNAAITAQQKVVQGYIEGYNQALQAYQKEKEEAK